MTTDARKTRSPTFWLLWRHSGRPGTGLPLGPAAATGTIAPYTIEEHYEVADAIERHDMEGLEEELGDPAGRSRAHGRRAGRFAFADVVDGIAR